jgi:hypothetical protein
MRRLRALALLALALLVVDAPAEARFGRGGGRGGGRGYGRGSGYGHGYGRGPTRGHGHAPRGYGRAYTPRVVGPYMFARPYGAGRRGWHGYLTPHRHVGSVRHGYRGPRYGWGRYRYGFYGAAIGSALVWIPGAWCWRHRGYTWVPGAWHTPPASGHVWLPGRWSWADDAWAWEEGTWAPGPTYATREQPPAPEEADPTEPGTPDDDDDAMDDEGPRAVPPAPPPLRFEEIPEPPHIEQVPRVEAPAPEVPAVEAPLE